MSHSSTAEGRRAREMANSRQLRERATQLIPGTTQTLSKGPTQWVQGVAPMYVRRALGAHVWDVDGNRYLDFPMALGPVILGHCDPVVNAAIARQLEDGITYTLPHELEVEVAELVVEAVPGAERVKFAKTGSDATSAAVRLARASTGRETVLAGGYHGWHDWYVGATSLDAGVPAAVRGLIDTFTYNDLASLDEALERHPNELAAVILEPVAAVCPEPGYLQAVIDRAHRAGALVIFDEVITGFRLGRGGAQERYGVQADLIALGKGLGNGMPISALVGPARIMDQLERVFFSGTHGGEALSLAAAKATLSRLTPAVYEDLRSKGERLRAGITAAVDEHRLSDWVGVSGEPERIVVQIREPGGASDRLVAAALVQQEMLTRGILFNGDNFICSAHTTDDIDAAISAYGEAFAQLANVLPDRVESVLEGDPLRPTFRPR